MTKISYPFIPKSTAYLKPGHFWSIPLDNGNFACGRVIQLKHLESGKIDTGIYLAGLMDWIDCKPPTSESIARRKTLKQGAVHIKTIRENQGEILGFRALEEDGIEPWLFLTTSAGRTRYLQRGFTQLHEKANQQQVQELPVFSTYGYGVIKILAEKFLAKR